jgi:hypothetical protein
MPQLKVCGGGSFGQYYEAFCPVCGCGGLFQFKSAYLALKHWNETQKKTKIIEKEGIFVDGRHENEK